LSFESAVDERQMNLIDHDLKNISSHHKEASPNLNLINEKMMMVIEKFESIIIVEQHSLILLKSLVMSKTNENSILIKTKRMKNQGLLKKNCLKPLKMPSI